jgi:pilus assembly protein FimV
VHKSNYKQIALAVCLAFLPFSAHSAGLGKLTVISGLGEPLRAEIDLVSTTPEELSSLSATIAPQETYAVQGMERRAIHSAIQIEVGKKPDGSSVLRLNTRQPVDDPFLDMLIQVDWATGRLLREYTVLLDPPGYQDTQPAMTVAPIQSQAIPTPSPVAASPVATAVTTVAPTASTQQAEQEYTTKSGDTLSKIAREMQVDGVSLDQMLVALYRANKDAFAGGNMNRLKVGQIIKAPSSEELTMVSRQEAAQEIKVQTADWNAYRNRLASVVAESAPTAEDAGDQAVSGKLKAATEDKAAPADTGPRDVVKLSKSEAEAAQAGADAKALQDRLTAMQEENTARQKSVEEANERVAMLEKQIADLQALLTIKDKTLAGLQDQAESVPEAGDAPVATEPEMVAAEEPASEPTPAAEAVEAPAAVDQAPVAEDKPKSAKKPVAAPAPAEEAGMLDGLLDNAPLLGLAGGAIVLLGGGWLFIRNRRRKNLDSFEQGILTAGGLKANTVFGNTSGGTVDTGDTSFLTNFSQNPSGMIDTHDVDPIAEAEVYMAYGRDSQAEEILNDAISKEPTRYELHLKLLEIFASRNDTSAFEAVAGELYSTLGSDDPVWMQVAEMGRKLEPTNPLYDTSKAHVADSSGDASKLMATTVMAAPADAGQLNASDFENAEVMADASLDFSLDADTGVSESNAAEVEEATKDTDSSLDFDLGFDSNPAEPEAVSAAPEVAMADTVQLDTGGLDFNMDFSDNKPAASTDDVSLTFTAPETQSTEQTIQFESLSLDETLPHMEMPSLNLESDDAAVQVAENVEDKNDIPDIGSLDLAQQEPASAAPELVESPKEESGLDFNFDLGGTTEPIEMPSVQAEVQEESASAETGLELDLSGISLDMEAPEEATAKQEAEGAEQESEEVNTKLDLVTAYMDMGDNEGARELLDEVLKEGGPRQRQRAQELFNSLS